MVLRCGARRVRAGARAWLFVVAGGSSGLPIRGVGTARSGAVHKWFSWSCVAVRAGCVQAPGLGSLSSRAAVRVSPFAASGLLDPVRCVSGFHGLVLRCAPGASRRPGLALCRRGRQFGCWSGGRRRAFLFYPGPIPRSASRGVCFRDLFPGAAQQKIKQQRHRAAGRAFGFAGQPGGARDVEVRPFVFFGEA